MEALCRSPIRFALLIAALLAAGALPVQAAERYPTKPIRLIVPSPTGSADRIDVDSPSSSKRSRTPHVNAPCAPPPCNANVTAFIPVLISCP
jgi:hypothetical protein